MEGRTRPERAGDGEGVSKAADRRGATGDGGVACLRPPTGEAPSPEAVGLQLAPPLARRWCGWCGCWHRSWFSRWRRGWRYRHQLPSFSALGA